MVTTSSATLNSHREFQQLKSHLHRQMIDAIDYSRAESMSPDELRYQLKGLAEYLCARHESQLDGTQQESMVNEIMDEIFRFGPLESLMVDPEVTDILVNGPNRILVERYGKLESTNL